MCESVCTWTLAVCVLRLLRTLNRVQTYRVLVLGLSLVSVCPIATYLWDQVCQRVTLLPRLASVKPAVSIGGLERGLPGPPGPLAGWSGVAGGGTPGSRWGPTMPQPQLLELQRGRFSDDSLNSSYCLQTNATQT